MIYVNIYIQTFISQYNNILLRYSGFKTTVMHQVKQQTFFHDMKLKFLPQRMIYHTL